MKKTDRGVKALKKSTNLTERRQRTSKGNRGGTRLSSPLGVPSKIGRPVTPETGPIFSMPNRTHRMSAKGIVQKTSKGLNPSGA